MKFSIPTPDGINLRPNSSNQKGVMGVLDLQAVNQSGLVLHCRLPLEPLSELVIGLQNDVPKDGEAPASSTTLTIHALVVSCRLERLRGGKPCYEVTLAFEFVTPEIRAWVEKVSHTLKDIKPASRPGTPLISWEQQETHWGLN